jgi:2-dehydro-3-deoxy-L-rhamnonate dehydrogenase (NAD+)
MMNEFTDQIAIVTGAASGIGCAIAHMLIKEGANVALLDINGKALEKEFKDCGPCTSIFPVDITQQSIVDETVMQVVHKYGKIDILINCAGITGKTNVLTHDICIEDVQRVFDVNFMSSFYTTRAVLPHMIRNEYGRILHLASIAGKEGNAGMLAYSASKAAVIGMTKVQGKEYAETGITINAIAPGVIKTILVDMLPETQVKYMTDKIPAKRCGTLNEIVDRVAYIISRKNSFITGFTFDLTGGRATY